MDPCLWFGFGASTATPICIALLEARNGLEQKGSNCYQGGPAQGTPRWSPVSVLLCGDPNCGQLIAVAVCSTQIVKVNTA